MQDKIFTIFAGVNGAGKSTLYRAKKQSNEDFGVRINSDEIVRSFGDWKNSIDQMKAGKMAIKLRKECVDKGIDFNQETTLTGNRILKFIDFIKEKGYKIHMFYVGLDSDEIAKKRIAERVKKGGHGIPDNVVEKRYIETLQNLKVVLPKVDQVEIYDNSICYNLIAVKQDGAIKLYSKNLPKWFVNIN